MDHIAGKVCIARAGMSTHPYVAYMLELELMIDNKWIYQQQKNMIQ